MASSIEQGYHYNYKNYLGNSFRFILVTPSFTLISIFFGILYIFLEREGISFFLKLYTSFNAYNYIDEILHCENYRIRTLIF